MPPTGKTSTTRLPRELIEELSLVKPSRRNGNNKRVPSRKERRKQEREVQKRQRIHLAKHGPPQLIPQRVSPTDQVPPSTVAMPVEKEPTKNTHLKSILKSAKPTKRKAESPEPPLRPYIRKVVKDKLTEDDAEISYLEKKLKIKSKKLPSSFQEDGLDLLMKGFDDDFLTSKKVTTKTRKTVTPELENDEDHESTGDENENDGLDDILGDRMHLDEDMGDHFSEIEGENQSENEIGEQEEEEFVRIDSNGEPEQEKSAGEQKFEASTSKYIPPSLRTAPTKDSGLLIHLQRQCKGLLNRLSEANMLSILSETETLYHTNPRGHVTSTLSDILITIICHPSLLLDTFMILHAGFVAGIYKLIGADFGAHIAQRIVEIFDAHYQKTNEIQDPSVGTKECTNLMSFLAELYNFHVVGCVLVFDLIRVFLGEITELNTELLLKIVRNSGTQLRHDDPAALKDLVQMVQSAITKTRQPNLSIRTKFMIQTLMNLKNNRLKSATASSTVAALATSRMKKLVGSLNNRQLRASEPLRASLADIRSTETKGKWWVVGASWVGSQATTTETPLVETPPKSTKSNPESGGFRTTTDLVQLAREQRMNTDVRRSIFVTVMSAEDYTDAYNRLLKLRLKRRQEPEIPRVLVHCCGSEVLYNPYYTLIARKLCRQHSHRVAFTFCLWDIFRRMGEDDGGSAPEAPDKEEDEGLEMRKMVNLSRMYGSLIAERVLTLNVLKKLNMAYLQSKTRTLLELMFINIILHSQRNITPESERDEKAIMDVFLKTAENVDLARSILCFLKKYVKRTDVAGGDVETATVRWGVDVACDGLKAIVARDTVGKEAILPPCNYIY